MIDIELYGGKLGFLKYIHARALYALRAHGDIRDIDLAAVRRLVFVCKGNICRSPYASARARALGLRAVSLGLAAEEGSPADAAAVRNASLRGIDLSGHRSKKVKSASFVGGDLVVAFELGQLAEIRRLFRGSRAACLLGVWVHPIHPHIQDPYGRSDKYFQRCFSLIDANVAAIASQLVRRVAAAAADDASGISDAKRAHNDFGDGAAD